MSGKVGHFCSVLQIPNPDVRISGSGAENQAVRMKLGASETGAGIVADFRDDVAGFDVGEGPVGVGRARQQIIAGRVKRQARDGALVSANDLKIGEKNRILIHYFCWMSDRQTDSVNADQNKCRLDTLAACTCICDD